MSRWGTRGVCVATAVSRNGNLGASLLVALVAHARVAFEPNTCYSLAVAITSPPSYL